MAPSATNRGALLFLDDTRVPKGVVIPPKEIKAIVEKTAGYVARNGLVFEDRIREKEKHNPRFSFLSLNDAYNAYYLWRLGEIRDGRGSALAAGRAGELMEVEKPKGPIEPPEFHFSARTPNINSLDLEVVRLTALFVGKNGRQFMTALSQRETGNYQFDFLRPNHSLHNFFQRLVDQYTALIRAGGIDGEGGKLQQERTQELELNLNDKFHVLARARQRAEWFKFRDEEKQRKEDEAQKERVSYAQIDWHDFVVVETVLFTEADDRVVLPPPTSLSELQYASLEQKAHMSMNAPNMRIEEAFPSEEDNYYSSYPSEVLSGQSSPVRPTQLAFHPQQQSLPTKATEEDEERELRIRERLYTRAQAQQAQAEAGMSSIGPMIIKENYVPRAAIRAANKQITQLAICPNCKQQIPFDELDEHMRIELLDPRWKEQKAKAESRYSTTNLWNNDAAINLKRLASQRSDLFDGVTGQPIITDEEAARRKKAASSYDGNPEAKDTGMAPQIQNVNVEEQIRAIHQKFGETKQ